MCFKSFRFCKKIFEIYLQCTIVKIDKNRSVQKYSPLHIDLVSAVHFHMKDFKNGTF